MLRGPWFQEGGIGEALEAIVDTVGNPEEATPTTHYFQYGVDPLLATNGKLLDTSKAQIEFKNIIGPIGHTFDINSDDPLFVNTSFVLPAPALSATASAPKDIPTHQPWNFCRLRLKRVIYLDETGKRKAESLETAPMWVQFLPPSSIFGGLDVAGLRMSLDAGGQTIHLKDGTTDATLKAVDSPQKIFSLYAVITRAVMDATGMQGQEAYVTVCRQEVGDPTLWTVLGPALAPSTDYRARIIEVQAGQNHAPGPYQDANSLWDALFKDDIKDSERARIVRISRPIDSVNRQPSEVHVCRSLVGATS